MTDFLIYQGKAAIALAAFYMFYRLLLNKETFHRFNRIMLIGTAVLCLALPMCVITMNRTVIMPAEENGYVLVEPVDEDYAMVPMEIVEEPAAEPKDVELWPFVVFGVFITGAVTVLLMSVISIMKVRSIIKSGTRQTLESGETLVITDNEIDPFSWMKYIVMSRKDYESGYSQILTHEKAHIALKHSWDILFVDMITALQWFNPAIWMMKADLRALHEFEADAVVLKSGTDIKEYQYLLIRKAVSKSGYSVANSFNHSTLKARITMMLNKKSSRMSVWKALYVIPLVGISLAATAETKVDYRYEDQQPETVADTLVDKDTKKSFREKNLYEGRLIVDEANSAVTMIYYGLDGKEYTAEWSGLNLNENVYMINGTVVTDKTLFDKEAAGENVVVLNSYLKNGKKVMAVVTPDRQFVGGKAHLEINVNIVTYEDPQNIVVENVENANNVVRIGSMDENGNEGDVDMNDIVFVVNGERMPEGFDLNTIDPSTITSMEVLKTEKALKEYETDKGVIVITTDPSKKNEEKPVPDVYINGKKASSEDIAALPANPKGHVEADGTIWITTEEKPKEEKKVVPFQQVTQKPTFNGGDANEFTKWVNENLRYPEECRQSKVQGRVTLQFTVTETGKVADVKVLRGVNAELDKEAIRVVSESPLWTPGKNDKGEIVSITYVFPVIFKIP